MENAVRAVPVVRVNTDRFSNAVEVMHKDYVESVDPIHHDCLAIVGVIGDQVATLKRLMAKVRISEITERKEAADAARDALTIFGLERIRADARHFLPEKRTPAERLLALVERRRGSLQKLAYDENTTQLDLLLEDLASDAAAADLAILELSDWHQALIDAAASFKAVREEERLLEGVEPGATLYPTKRALARLFSLLFDISHFHADNGNATFADLLRRSTNTVNELKRYANEPLSPPPEPEAPAA